MHLSTTKGRVARKRAERKIISRSPHPHHSFVIIMIIIIIIFT